ncbi:MAG: hypothetical protein CM1200mP9_11050 [Gammaproteobacteria bacterium]|nr:MAG: hypothetical protein CM1200mP9_11050 [Gammaproteobacteria bacterium]
MRAGAPLQHHAAQFGLGRDWYSKGSINGVTLNYEVLGEGGPWIVLTPGGRGDLEGVRYLGNRLAREGYRSFYTTVGIAVRRTS